MNFLPIPELPATREQLEAELLAAEKSLDAGKGVSGKKSLRQFRRRIKKLQSKRAEL